MNEISVEKKQNNIYIRYILNPGYGEGVLEIAMILGLAMFWRPIAIGPNLLVTLLTLVFPHIPWLLTTRIDITTFCLVSSMAAWQARLSSASSALDFAISYSLDFLLPSTAVSFPASQSPGKSAKCEKCVINS